MTRWLNALIASALLIASCAIPASAQNPTMRTAMREKLRNTERLFEAVIASDFVNIRRSADALSRVSQTEILTWQSNPPPDYLKQAMAFITATKGLREAATKRNVEAALAEYVTLASSCTRCHASIQRLRVISFER
jgi:hypothetical protein